MSRLLHWVTMTPTARYHAHYHTDGTGHFYQGRFKSFPIQSDEHFFVACRYVERNALAAGLVTAAQGWRFGSLHNRAGGRCGVQLTAWPMPRSLGWIKRVSQPLSEKEEGQLRTAIRRSQPLADAGWVATTARQYNLESTVRSHARPSSFPNPPGKLLSFFLQHIWHGL